MNDEDDDEKSDGKDVLTTDSCLLLGLGQHFAALQQVKLVNDQMLTQYWSMSTTFSHASEGVFQKDEDEDDEKDKGR
ncbi:Protein of unknown function [Gryllus bimaculatus]|nr:Protein of unknown function [Gryllus bimaculatus]